MYHNKLIRAGINGFSGNFYNDKVISGCYLRGGGGGGGIGYQVADTGPTILHFRLL